MRQDIGYALHVLRTSHGFAAIAILSLALGIGANTAIFTLIDAVILKPLPVSHPEQLLQVTMDTPQFFTNPVWEHLRDRQDVFSGIFAYGKWAFNLAHGGEARKVNGQYVSGGYFEALGVRPVLGRMLMPSDDRRDCPGLAVLSNAFWKREYGGRKEIIGKPISIDNHPFEIVGVAQPGFTGVEVGLPVDVLVPICAERVLHGEQSLLDKNYARGWGWLQVMGRMRPDLTLPQITARLKTLAPRIFAATQPLDWRTEDVNEYLKTTLVAQPATNGLSWVRRQYRLALGILMAIVAVVLLIACANIANLLLARGAARQREIGIRMALGAGRARLIRHLLMESLLLSLTGAALGMLLARWCSQLLVRFLNLPIDLTLDLRVLSFTIGVAVFTAVLFGLAPAWRATRADPQSVMKISARGVMEGSTFGLGKLLVAAQVALSLLLVVGAGLMLSTLWKLTTLDPGFKRDHVLLATVDLGNIQFAKERQSATMRQILQSLRAIPGVRPAAASAIITMCGCKGEVDLAVEGYTPKLRGDAVVLFNRVSDRYFENLATPFVAGRDFDEHDIPSSPPVAIVNQSMARKYFGAANPLGKHYRYREQGGKLSEPVEIVGVVRDAKYGSLRQEIAPVVYASWNQAPNNVSYFVLRSSGALSKTLTEGVKSAVAAVNRDASLQLTTLSGEIEESLTRERLLAALSTIFGALALLLSMIGLYGVMSYKVAARRNEIGLRMALGAERTRVLRMVLGEAAILVAAGLAIGFVAVIATTRFVASFLYELQPNDPLILSAAAAALACVGVLAGCLPARRASRLDPMTALREE